MEVTKVPCHPWLTSWGQIFWIPDLCTMRFKQSVRWHLKKKKKKSCEKSTLQLTFTVNIFVRTCTLLGGGKVLKSRSYDTTFPRENQEVKKITKTFMQEYSWAIWLQGEDGKTSNGVRKWSLTEEVSADPYTFCYLRGGRFIHKQMKISGFVKMA